MVVIRLVLALALALACGGAQAQFNQQNWGFTQVTGTVAPPTPCTATGLDFSQFCNSQYLVVIK